MQRLTSKDSRCSAVLHRDARAYSEYVNTMQRRHTSYRERQSERERYMYLIYVRYIAGERPPLAYGTFGPPDPTPPDRPRLPRGTWPSLACACTARDEGLTWPPTASAHTQLTPPHPDHSHLTVLVCAGAAWMAILKTRKLPYKLSRHGCAQESGGWSGPW